MSSQCLPGAFDLLTSINVKTAPPTTSSPTKICAIAGKNTEDFASAASPRGGSFRGPGLDTIAAIALADSGGFGGVAGSLHAAGGYNFR